MHREQTALYRTRKLLALGFVSIVTAAAAFGAYKGVRRAADDVAVTQLAARYENRAKDLEAAFAELQNERKQVTKERESLKESVQNELQGKHQGELTALKKTYEAQLASLNTAHTSNNHALRLEFTNQLATIRTNYVENMQSLQERKNKEMQELRTKETAPLKQQLEETSAKRKEYESKAAEYVALVETLRQRTFTTPNELTNFVDKSSFTGLERELLFESHFGKQALVNMTSKDSKFFDKALEHQRILGYSSEEPRGWANLLIVIKDAKAGALLAAYNFRQQVGKPYPTISSLLMNAKPEFELVFGAQKRLEVFRYGDGRFSVYEGTELLSRGDSNEMMEAQAWHARAIRNEFAALYAPLALLQPEKQQKVQQEGKQKVSDGANKQ